MSRNDWLRVNRNRPCPVCKRPDWCILSVNGEAVICARVQSSRMVGKKGAGWLHRLREPIPKFEKPVKENPIVRDWPALAMQYADALPEQDDLADVLHVDPSAMFRLMLGWSAEHACYTFPMRDGIGNIIGIRTRYRNGSKYAIKGSSAGLFIPMNLPNDGDIWVCEGPTDCAALLTLGLNAIGRPSNTGGLQYLIPALRQRRKCDVLIVADRDEPGSDAERLTMLGATTLAGELKKVNKRCKIIRPTMHKDCRDMLIDGATANVFLSMANNTECM